MEITIPYNYTPRSYQLNFHKAKQRFKIAILNRRAGKSKMALNEQIRKAVLGKGIYYYFLPTYRQAKSVIWDSLIKEHLPKEVVTKINESELAVYYKNGSVQRFAGCEDIDKHRGINPIDVVFDEYSEMNEEIWTAIVQPILGENMGTATFVYTPKGKNHSWKLLQIAKNDTSRWFWMVMGVNETHSHSEEELEEIKKEVPESLFLQEYLCEFHDNAGAFFRRIRENIYAYPYTDAERGHVYQLGVDLAKYQDWTVVTPFDLNTFRVGKQDRFNQIDWNLQKARIEATCRRFNNGRIFIDSTGVGDPITEDLQGQGLPIEPYRFTETSKMALLKNLAILLEQDKIKIPDDDGLVAELDSIVWALNKNGRAQAKTLPGMTDDRVMSLALSVWGITNPISNYVDNPEDFGVNIVTYS